jgi:hypothetical protein
LLEERVADLMAALAEAATNSTRLAEELDQERAAAYSSWSWSTAFTVLGVLVWLFRWGGRCWQPTSHGSPNGTHSTGNLQHHIIFLMIIPKMAA